MYAEKIDKEFGFFMVDAPAALKAVLHETIAPPPIPRVKWIRRWNQGNIVMSDNDTCVDCISSEGGIVTGDVVANSFSVRVDRRGDNGWMFIGFITPDLSGTSGYRWYGIKVDTGRAALQVGAAAPVRHAYSTPVMNGEVITVIREGTSISMLRNGAPLGVAFTDVPAELTLYPFASLWRENQRISSV